MMNTHAPHTQPAIEPLRDLQRYMPQILHRLQPPAETAQATVGEGHHGALPAISTPQALTTY